MADSPLRKSAVGAPPQRPAREKEPDKGPLPEEAPKPQQQAHDPEIGAQGNDGKSSPAPSRPFERSYVSEPLPAPPIWSASSLADAVGAEFRAAVNPQAANLRQVLHRASRYAVVEPGKEAPRIVVRRRSLLCAMLEDGLHSPAAQSTSAVFAAWVASRQFDSEELLRAQEREREVRAAVQDGGQLVPGQTVDRLFPRAQELAQRTVGRAQFDLRHLVVALIENPGNSFDLFAPIPGDAEIAELRQEVIARTVAAPAPGESVARWRAIAAEQASTDADDRLPTQTDNPAARDLLGRDMFARVLARRIKLLQVQALDAAPAASPETLNGAAGKTRRPGTGSATPASRRAFMIHVHGRWGAGKSSFLQFLKAHLERAEADSPPSMVVWFNAWEHHARRPPWWVFLNGIYRSVVSGRHTAPLPHAVRLRIRARWWWWRIRSELLPIFAVLAVGLVLYQQVSLDTFTKVITGVLALAAAVYAVSKGMVFGSRSAAEAYTRLTDDPIAPVVRLFDAIAAELAAADRPLVVLLDDLDRCDSDFLVELLEGIQNLFKGSPVTYVAAADRDWICSAFERRYADFAPRIGEPARPLGFLFLDKLFQISAGMPKLTLETKEQYFKSLTSGARPDAAASEAQRAQAAQTMAGLATEEEIQTEVRRAEQNGNTGEVLAAREAAALQFTSARAEAATEKRLAGLIGLMEPNPRAMKLLVNEVAMAQARGVLEGRHVPAEARARWSILSLRWPLLADALAENPSLLGIWLEGNACAATALPASLRHLAEEKQVQRTIGQADETGALSEAVLRDIIS